MRAGEFVSEALTAQDPVEKWIAVFKKSSHPKFAGKTPEQREKQARMAHYRAVQNKSQSGVAEHIVKVKGGYELRSKHGNKNLGKYPTRAGAEKRERQVQYFKHAKEGMAEGDMAPVHVSGKELPGAVERLERVLLNAKRQGKKLDYDHIDLIMQQICHKHNLTGDKLHDDFVSKHHQVPDNWIKKQEVEEGWSKKYKRSIDCSHPKGFSQKAHCAGRKKTNEADGLDMSRRGFLRGAGAAAATAVTGLPRIQADALTKILNSVGADFLEQMVHKASRGSIRFFLDNNEYNKVTRMGDVFPDQWFEQHKKNPVAAYRNLTGELPKFAKVLDVLRSSGLEPTEFLGSEPVQRVAKEVQDKWQAKWRASGASADPFKSPGEPAKLDKPAEPRQLAKADIKQLAKPKYKGLADPDEEELAIGRAGVTETRDTGKTRC